MVFICQNIMSFILIIKQGVKIHVRYSFVRRTEGTPFSFFMEPEAIAN